MRPVALTLQPRHPPPDWARMNDDAHDEEAPAPAKGNDMKARLAALAQAKRKEREVGAAPAARRPLPCRPSSARTPARLPPARCPQEEAQRKPKKQKKAALVDFGDEDEDEGAAGSDGETRTGRHPLP